MPTNHKPYSVLFVCMGNICRSPAAEIVFRKLVNDADLSERLRIDSAGTIGYHSGSPPDRRMSATLESRGYRISGHSRQIKVADLNDFNLILVADQENLDDVRSLDPSGTHHSKIQLLTDYCRQHQADYVPDPYYGGSQGFEKVADLVEDACAGMLETVENHLDS